MKTTEKLSRSAVIAELESAAKDIAVLYIEANIVLHTLQKVVEGTLNEREPLVEVLGSLKDFNNEDLSPNELEFIDAKLFSSKLCNLWNTVQSEKDKIEELYKIATEICERIESLSRVVNKMYQDYADKN